MSESNVSVTVKRLDEATPEERMTHERTKSLVTSIIDLLNSDIESQRKINKEGVEPNDHLSALTVCLCELAVQTGTSVKDLMIGVVEVYSHIASIYDSITDEERAQAKANAINHGAKNATYN